MNKNDPRIILVPHSAINSAFEIFVTFKLLEFHSIHKNAELFSLTIHVSCLRAFCTINLIWCDLSLLLVQVDQKGFSQLIEIMKPQRRQLIARATPNIDY